MNKLSHSWEAEIQRGERFAFGENWAAFLRLLTEERIRTAEGSLKDMLRLDRLDGKRFLDVGSGSGLFSLAARRMGADVVSFDFDPQSVGCTAELKRRYFHDDVRWRVEQGSVLDPDFLSGLGAFDIVYSWGVLHHTGAMWNALEKVAQLVAPRGQLFIAIYNDQGRTSRIWKRVKRAYVRAPGVLKWLVLAPAFARLWGPTLLRDTLSGTPLRTWKSYDSDAMRAMDPWRNVLDWVGGYPFEVARPDQIFEFFRGCGFELQRLKTCAGGHGCNEFVFMRSAAARGLTM
jgi:2-polyprenyl-3-methyl-5-hydroxy-6-metoxy-1,4-benzoquinol methylase